MDNLFLNSLFQLKLSLLLADVFDRLDDELQKKPAAPSKKDKWYFFF